MNKQNNPPCLSVHPWMDFVFVLLFVCLFVCLFGP